MSKGRHSRATLLGPTKKDRPDTFFRLCHHCLFLNESEWEITQCCKCNVKFSANAENKASPVSEEELFDQEMEGDEALREGFQNRQAPSKRKTFLTGLNVKW